MIGNVGIPRKPSLGKFPENHVYLGNSQKTMPALLPIPGEIPRKPCIPGQFLENHACQPAMAWVEGLTDDEDENESDEE